jgi:hypothetical protein
MDADKPSPKANRANVKNNFKALVSPEEIDRRNRKRHKPGVFTEEVTETLTSEMGDNVDLNEQNLNALYNQDAPSNKDVIEAIMEAQKITNAKLAPLAAVVAKVNENSEQISQVKSKVTAIEKGQSVLSDKVAVLEQAKFENQATITGFKSPPENSALLDALNALFGVNPASIVNVQSFKIKTKAGKEMTITNLTFTNRFEKGKLMAAKIAKGNMKVAHFFPSLSHDEGADEQVFIGHKLTRINIQIRKSLDVLKAEKKILNKRFRNNNYQFQQNTNGPWRDVPTIRTLKQLFPSNSNTDSAMDLD